MNANTISTEVYKPHYSTGKTGQKLRKLGDLRVSANRFVSAGESQRISFTGGQTLKIRRPDLGETGLSESEIDHAMTYGISA